MRLTGTLDNAGFIGSLRGQLGAENEATSRGMRSSDLAKKSSERDVTRESMREGYDETIKINLLDDLSSNGSCGNLDDAA